MFAIATSALTLLERGTLNTERAMLGTTELLVIFGIIVVMFGATKLPQLGKGLGEAIGNFKKAQRDAEREISQSGEIDATPKLDRDQERKP